MSHDLHHLLGGNYNGNIDCTHLLAQEVTDLKSTTVLLDDAVDGEMGVDGAHLVLEALEKHFVRTASGDGSGAGVPSSHR